MAFWNFSKEHPNVALARKYAKKYGWEERQYNENNKVIAFHRKLSDTLIRINIFYTTMTVGTALNHKKMGKTQLFRKNVTKELLKELFQNPRTHTGGGYYIKRDTTYVNTKKA